MINNGSKYFIILFLFIYVKIFDLIYKVVNYLYVNFRDIIYIQSFIK